MGRDRFKSLTKEKLKAQDEFIQGASYKIKDEKQASKRERVYKQYLFSLTEAVSTDIDDLTTSVPRASRSDIVKAGILALKNMSDDDVKSLILKVKE